MNIPVTVYEEVKPAQRIEVDGNLVPLGEIVREGNSLYLVTTINKGENNEKQGNKV